MKFAKISILLLMIVVLIAACGSGNTANNSSNNSSSNNNSGSTSEPTKPADPAPAPIKPTTINFIMSSESDVEAYQAIFDNFKEETGHTVEMQILPAGEDYDNMLKIRFSTGDHPDIFQMQPGTKQNIKFQAEENLYDWRGHTEILNRIEDSFVEFQTTPAGEIYGIPWGSMGAFGIYYNKAVFADAGVSEPENFDDLLAIAQILKDKGYIPFYESMSTGWPAQIFHLSGWVSWVDPEIGEEGVKQLDRNELKLNEIDALRDLFAAHYDIYQKGLFQDNVMAGTYEMAQESLGNNEVGMLFGLNGLISSMADKFGDDWVNENLGFFPFPGKDDQGVAMITQPSQMMVSRDGPNLDATIQLVEFMTNMESLNIWYDHQKRPPVYKGIENEVYDVEKTVLEYVERGQSMVNVQNRLSPTFVDLVSTLQNLFIDGDVDEALNDFDANFRRDGAAKLLPGFE